MIEQLIRSFLIIFLGILIGYLVQILVKKGKLKIGVSLVKVRKFLQKLAILFFVSIVFIGVYWAMDFHQLELLFFPLLGILNLILGGIIALLFAKSIHMNNKDTGSFFCCGFFSNVVSIGGLVCFLFLGEQGYALVPLYTLILRIAYYAIGFPIAKYYSIKETQNDKKVFNLKNILKDPFILVLFTSITIGLGLNASGLKRPAIYSSIIAIFVPTYTILLLISIGLSTKFDKVRNYLKESIIISGIKFLIVPALMVSIGYFMGYHQINDGLPLKVILILSSAPVAFHALIPPSQYGLNLDLANSCWIFTTLCLIIWVPLLFFLVNII
ncbi:MAG: hypothetical protein JXC36_08750 [Candidatus Atribacteria bacterium]|nr:hypothetical protein [Candidatus Atribacteria bacterium]